MNESNIEFPNSGFQFEYVVFKKARKKFQTLCNQKKLINDFVDEV